MLSCENNNDSSVQNRNNNIVMGDANHDFNYSPSSTTTTTTTTTTTMMYSSGNHNNEQPLSMQPSRLEEYPSKQLHDATKFGYYYASNDGDTDNVNNDNQEYTSTAQSNLITDAPPIIPQPLYTNQQQQQQQEQPQSYTLYSNQQQQRQQQQLNNNSQEGLNNSNDYCNNTTADSCNYSYNADVSNFSYSNNGNDMPVQNAVAPTPVSLYQSEHETCSRQQQQQQRCQNTTRSVYPTSISIPNHTSSYSPPTSPLHCSTRQTYAPPPPPLPSTTQQTPTPPPPPPCRAALRLKRQLNEREQFLMFVKVLFRIIDGMEEEEEGPRLKQRAKVVIGDCTRRNRNQEPEYLSLQQSIEERLRPVVGESPWLKAKDYMNYFLYSQQQQQQQHRQEQQVKIEDTATITAAV